MAKHPIYLPFTYVGNSWQYTTIYDKKQDVVCRFDLEDWHVTEDNQGALEEDQADLVKFMVKAANNHDALVSALTELYAQVCGECPSLLNEDSGGDSRLGLAIQDVLASVGEVRDPK